MTERFALGPGDEVWLNSPYGVFKFSLTDEILNGHAGVVMGPSAGGSLAVDWRGVGRIDTPSHWVTDRIADLKRERNA